MGIGDWGLGIGDWGLGPIPNPQSPIPILSTSLIINIKIIKDILNEFINNKLKIKNIK
jgi:hypothetical protein